MEKDWKKSTVEVLDEVARLRAQLAVEIPKILEERKMLAEQLGKIDEILRLCGVPLNFIGNKEADKEFVENKKRFAEELRKIIVATCDLEVLELNDIAQILADELVSMIPA